MLGKKISFGSFELHKIAVAPQQLIQHGYRACTRRTYFLRLHRDSGKVQQFVRYDKSKAVQDFLKTGRIDLEHIPPKELLSRIVELKKAICNTNSFYSLDCAFTYQGLKELGLQNDLLKVFRLKSKAFYEGAYLRAQDYLNDTDASAPEGWHKAYQEEEDNAVDIVLVAHFAATSAGVTPVQPNPFLIHAFEASLLKHIFEFDPMGPPAPTRTGLSVAAVDWVEESIPIDLKGSVYFGYKDGITAPIFSCKGQKIDATGYTTRHALGEIFLGFPRNGKDSPYSELTLYPQASSAGGTALAALNEQEISNLDFFRGSSFGVLRKMQQLEKLFDKWIIEAAQSKAVVRPADEPAWQQWIKAKLLGRIAKDCPPTLAAGSIMTPDIQPEHFVAYAGTQPAHYPPALGKEMGFYNNDPRGLGCPFGSHIRRMNPRDDPVAPFITRPLLRRGMTYQTTVSTNGELEVGLSGLFLCADITEQFEHLVGKWANGRVHGVDSDPDSRDPIIGNHQAGDRPFVIHQDHHDQNKIELKNPQTPFVITRGTLYTWFPTKKVLEEMRNYLMTPHALKK